MKPRSIKISQRNLETGAVRTAELCWRYLCLISDAAGRRGPTPAAILDKLLWGDEVRTDRFAYSIQI